MNKLTGLKKAREAARHVVVLEILKSQAFVVVKTMTSLKIYLNLLPKKMNTILRALARTANGMGIAAVVEERFLR